MRPLPPLPLLLHHNCSLIFRANSEVTLRNHKLENSLKLVKRKAAKQLQLRFSLALISLVCSAGYTAQAVERMRDKCEQQTMTAVGLATINLSRDLKNSHRVGAVLQSKLSKAQVIPSLTQCTTQAVAKP
jgi:hypothetical protein